MMDALALSVLHFKVSDLDVLLYHLLDIFKNPCLSLLHCNCLTLSLWDTTDLETVSLHFVLSLGDGETKTGQVLIFFLCLIFLYRQLFLAYM